MPPSRVVPVLLLALPLAGQVEGSRAPGLEPLFTAFRAYQRKPAGHREALLAALPRSASGRKAYAALAYAPDPTPSASTPRSVRPGLWEIQDAVLDLARQGEPRAIRWILAMAGEGEGFGKDALELFKEPQLVARHWPLFASRKASLKHLKTWTYPQNYPALRAGYAQAFGDRPALRDELLALLDEPE